MQEIALNYIYKKGGTNKSKRVKERKILVIYFIIKKKVEKNFQTKSHSKEEDMSK